MPGKNMTKSPADEVDPATIASVDDLLDELDLDSYDSDEVSDDANLSDDELKAMEVDEIVSKSYEETEVKASKPAKKKADSSKDATKTKPAKASKKAMVRDLTALPAETFVLEGTPADLEANKVSVLTKRPLQKKIGEKFDNLFISLAAGRKPSTFILQCLDFLNDHTSATSVSLMAAMRENSTNKGEKYNEKTASSQVGQIMVLFDAVGIATRDGNTLTVNTKSTVRHKIRDILEA